MSKLDQYLSAKLPTSRVLEPQAHKRRVDARAALYRSFAEDERAEEARVDRTPLVRWARGTTVSDAPPSKSKPTRKGIAWVE